MLDNKLLLELQEYVDSHINSLYLNVQEKATRFDKCVSHYMQPLELEDYIKDKRKTTFNQVLFNFIEQKGASDIEVYKKAGLDRRHFSKIRSKPDYRIGKYTAVALALALELNTSETELLLNAGGYSLSDCDTFDLIVQFFLEKKIYDIFALNEALDYFGLKPLPIALE